MANMWKYITRNVRETFERRICTSLTDSSGQDKNSTCKFREKFLPTVNTFCDKRNVSGNKYTSAASGEKREERSHERSWNDTYVRNTWLGAVGWSTAIVLSWNLLQPLCRLHYSHTNNKERQCPLSRHASFSTRWGGPKGWHWKREISSQNNPSRFHFVCPRSKKSRDQLDGVWDSGRHSYTGGHKTSNRQDDDWDSGHHSLDHERHHSANADAIPLRAHYDSNYSGFWKLLTQTVWAQPACILPKSAKLEIDYAPKNEVASTSYGPPTAEQALDDAAAKFVEAQNSLMGDMDNRLGVELMQKGKHHEAVARFTRASDFNNASASYNLGVCYEMGLGTVQDFKKAAKYYQAASDKGHPTAMYNLGVFYVHGWGGLSSDTDEAHKLFEKASALGQSEAIKALNMVKEKEPPPLPSVITEENSKDLVQQALELVQDLGLGFRGVPQVECVVNPTDHKDISDMVQDSIVKYTSMLQK
ncbi:hypothetical protein R5R35_011423 [Gryllus longicercus]|uniref:Uncharacterized protein n=1 Tax=Gryllus longicercus TaxID=2509291 RepID=A0AAN9VCB7_9ORTH